MLEKSQPRRLPRGALARGKRSLAVTGYRTVLAVRISLSATAGRIRIAASNAAAFKLPSHFGPRCGCDRLHGRATRGPALSRRRQRRSPPTGGRPAVGDFEVYPDLRL